LNKNYGDVGMIWVYIILGNPEEKKKMLLN
jgi:hypothetical protein